MLNIRKNLIAAAVGVALSAGLASEANAVPMFTVNPASIPGTSLGDFNATSLSGSSSELLTVTSPSTLTGSGYVLFSSFEKNNIPVLSATSGLDSTYGLYITFQLAASSASGTIGAPGSIQNLTALNFQVYADPTLTDVTNNVTPADSAGTGTPATVTDTGLDDILLGNGSLVAGTGVAGFDAGGGAYLNSKENFTLTADGSNFFVAPVPFYQFAFDEFNNTGQGPSINGNLIAINEATGKVDFNRVPEPGSLALIGIALLGLVGLGRRRSA